MDFFGVLDLVTARGNELQPGVVRIVPVEQAIGTVLAHDITEIRPGDFKGTAFKKGHVVCRDDVERLRLLGKNHLYVLDIDSEHLHEDEAAVILAESLRGSGVRPAGPPSEGKINLLAEHRGLLRIDRKALLEFNLLGEVMCATRHDGTVVEAGTKVAGTRAIPLVVSRRLVERASAIAGTARGGVVSVLTLRPARAGLVITGTEVFQGKVEDVFGPIMSEKLARLGGEIIGVEHAPDDVERITACLQDLLDRGADLLITTGGMSVDPDDVTRHAIRNLGVRELYYGSPVLPGAMFLVAWLERDDIPVLGVPACGMYASTTVFDLVLPRVLAGEHVERRALAELGHGGLCLKCSPCRFPVCPFGK